MLHLTLKGENGNGEQRTWKPSLGGSCGMGWESRLHLQQGFFVPVPPWRVPSKPGWLGSEPPVRENSLQIDKGNCAWVALGKLREEKESRIQIRAPIRRGLGI